jgi:hypothetical protein
MICSNSLSAYDYSSSVEPDGYCSAAYLISSGIVSTESKIGNYSNLNRVMKDDDMTSNSIYFNPDNNVNVTQVVYYNSLGVSQSSDFQCNNLPECKVSWTYPSFLFPHFYYVVVLFYPDYLLRSRSYCFTDWCV